MGRLWLKPPLLSTVTSYRFKNFEFTLIFGVNNKKKAFKLVNKVPALFPSPAFYARKLKKINKNEDEKCNLVNDFKQWKNVNTMTKCINNYVYFTFWMGNDTKRKNKRTINKKNVHTREWREGRGRRTPPPFEKFNHLNLHSKIPLKKDFDPSPPKNNPRKLSL